VGWRGGPVATPSSRVHGSSRYVGPDDSLENSNSPLGRESL
jgi:hypothetical protein